MTASRVAVLDFPPRLPRRSEPNAGRLTPDVLGLLGDMAQPCSADVAVELSPDIRPLAADLASRVARLWVVEPTPKPSLAAEVHDGTVEVLTGTPAAVPLADESVDLVVSERCFHRLTDCGKRQALREIHRILRPGGRLAFADLMLPPRATDRHDRRVAPRDPAKRGGLQAVMSRLVGALSAEVLRRGRQKRRHWWEKELARIGFVIVEVRALGPLGASFVPARRKGLADRGGDHLAAAAQPLWVRRASSRTLRALPPTPRRMGKTGRRVDDALH